MKVPEPRTEVHDVRIAWLDSRSGLILGLLLAGVLSSGDSGVFRTARSWWCGYWPSVLAGCLVVFFEGLPGG